MSQSMKFNSNSSHINSSQITDAMVHAKKLVAPVWPLNRMVAVNPWWNSIDSQWIDCATTLSVCANIKSMMPMSYYKECYRTGDILERHLAEALRLHNRGESKAAFIRQLDLNTDEIETIQLLSEFVADKLDITEDFTTDKFILNEVSKFCSTYFASTPKHDNLFQAWKRHISENTGLKIQCPDIWKVIQKQRITDKWEDMLEIALNDMGVPSESVPQYFQAVILRVKGWASWCAFMAWEHGLTTQIDQLVAIRVVWEWMISKASPVKESLFSWRNTIHNWPAWTRQWHAELQRLSVWQDAREIAFEDKIKQGLSEQPFVPPAKVERPDVQALFCIDVRSAELRAAFEDNIPNSETFGMAGFFGLPIAIQHSQYEAPLSQMPVLFAPSVTIDVSNDATDKQYMDHSTWKAFQTHPMAALAYVESMGGKDVWGLFKRGFLKSLGHTDVNTLTEQQNSMSGVCEDKTALYLQLFPAIKQQLESIHLTERFAKTVIVFGHASETANNPHAHSLDCGACGGQSGWLNAYIFADALNSSVIRKAMAEQGIVIPDDTFFYPGLHNTTQNKLVLGECSVVNEIMRVTIPKIRVHLENVTKAIHSENHLDLKKVMAPSESVEDTLRRFASDWAEVQNEWGLAGNAGFYIGPRASTSGLKIKNQMFLHDYYWDFDEEMVALESIMTGPLIVAHWINFQYYASVVDNHHYGAGDKTLHNIVAGNLGVLEGGAGDLRTGLSMQSLYQNDKLMHEPVRLTVFIEAPKASVEEIISKHDVIAKLVNHRWINLCVIEPTTKQCYRYINQAWQHRPLSMFFA